jgi:hypothetical protein
MKEGHILAGLCQIGPDTAADRPDAQDCQLLAHKNPFK